MYFLISPSEVVMNDITQGWSNLSLIDREEDDMKLTKKGN